MGLGYWSDFNLIQRKSSFLLSGVMNARNAFQSVGIQTPAELGELRLRSPRPAATSE